MILEAISGILVILTFVAFIVVSILIMMESSGCDIWEDIFAIVVVFLMSVAIGAFLGMPSFLNIIKDEKCVYSDPTYILRTNNVTHVIYIFDDKVRTESHTDVKYWVAENIQIENKSGKNIWNINVTNEISVVIK